MEENYKTPSPSIIQFELDNDKHKAYVVWSHSLDILLSVFGPPLPSLGYHTAEFSSGGLSKNIITSAIRPSRAIRKSVPE
jgi:hypothetical protein